MTMLPFPANTPRRRLSRAEQLAKLQADIRQMQVNAADTGATNQPKVNLPPGVVPLVPPGSLVPLSAEATLPENFAAPANLAAGVVPEMRDILPDPYPYQAMPGSPRLPRRPVRDRASETRQTGAGLLGALAGLLLTGNKRAIPGAVSGVIRGSRATQDAVAQDAEETYQDETRRTLQENELARQAVGDTNTVTDRRYRREQDTARATATQNYRDQQLAFQREKLGETGENVDEKARGTFTQNLPRNLASLSAQDGRSQATALKAMRAEAERLGLPFNIPIPGEPTGRFRTMPKTDGSGGTKEYPIVYPPLKLTPQDINRLANAAFTDTKTDYVPKNYELGARKAATTERQGDERIAQGAERNAMMKQRNDFTKQLGLARLDLQRAANARAEVKADAAASGKALDPQKEYNTLEKLISSKQTELSRLRPKQRYDSSQMKYIDPDPADVKAFENTAAAINQTLALYKQEQEGYARQIGMKRDPSGSGKLVPLTGNVTATRQRQQPSMIVSPIPAGSVTGSGLPQITLPSVMPNMERTDSQSRHHSAAQPRTSDGKFNGSPQRPTTRTRNTAPEPEPSHPKTVVVGGRKFKISTVKN